MKKTVKKIIIGSMVVLPLMAASVSAFASPWGPRQMHREDKLHHVRHREHRQERKADRALSNGNIGGFFRHQQRASDLHDRAHHIHHKINRSNHRWERHHGW